MNLDEMAKEANLLVHGSPHRGLKQLIAFDGGTLALDEDGRPIASAETIYSTRSTALAVFVATVWSRDGLSGWHSYLEPGGEVWFQFFAAPYVLRQALDAAGSIYLVSADDFLPHRQLACQWVLRDNLRATRVVEEIPVTVWDMDTRIWQSAHLARNQNTYRPTTGNGPHLNAARLRSRARDLRHVLPLPPEFTNWYEYLAHLERT
jgi:hypothetical protein